MLTARLPSWRAPASTTPVPSEVKHEVSNSWPFLSGLRRTWPTTRAGCEKEPAGTSLLEVVRTSTASVSTTERAGRSRAATT
jgi:hypothetical protein